MELSASTLPPSRAQNTARGTVKSRQCGREGRRETGPQEDEASRLSVGQSGALPFLQVFSYALKCQPPFSYKEVALCTKVVGFVAYA